MKIYSLSPECWVHHFENTIDDKRFKIEYFPDFYFNTLKIPNESSFFDYTTFLIHTSNIQIESEDLDNIKNTIVNEFENIPDNQKLEWILKNTSMIHEMRHFHDSIGTTAGILRTEIILRDIISFILQIFHLKAKKEEKNILISTGIIAKFKESFNVPDWEDYIHQHLNTVQSLSFYDGSFYVNRSSGRTNKKNFLVGFSGSSNLNVDKRNYESVLLKYNFPEEYVGELSIENIAFFPVIPLMLSPNEIDNIAMGYKIMTENNAWICQYNLIYDLFGQKYANDIKHIIQRQNPHKYPYMALDLLVSKHYKPFHMDILTYYSDKSLNSKQLFDNSVFSYPGWIITEKINGEEIRKMTNDRSYHSDQFNEEILNHQNAINSLERLAKEAEELSITFSSRIMKLISKFVKELIHSASRIQELRKQVPDIFANPDSYFNNYDKLPYPPIMAVPRDESEYNIITTSTKDSITHDELNLWLFIVNMIATSLHKDEVKCPLKHLKIYCSDKSPDCELDINKPCFYKRFLSFI